MKRSHRRLIWLIVAVIAVQIGATLLYQLGMTHLEGKPRTFLQAFGWASETLSTTGYGADARWTHPLMVLLVVSVQFFGVFLVFLIVPIYLLPFLSERFEQRVPRVADEKLDKHVIVYGFGPTVETLLQRLAANGIATLVVETDENRARAVMETGQAVVFSRAEEDVLGVCKLDRARAIVANERDQENAAMVLRARQMGFTGEIYAFVEDPSHRKPMELAGATAAYTPRHIVAAALAAHASDQLSPRLPGLEQIDGVERREIRIATNSRVAGMTLAEAALPAVVVGVWHRSRLTTRCTPDLRLEPGLVVEMVGTPDALAISANRLGAPLLRNTGPFLIGGFGEVGRKVRELLTDVGEDVIVIEQQAGENVDFVGDVLDGSVLLRAGIDRARALLLALDSDDSTLFATVIARDLVADVPVIARVNHARNLDNIHRAGADYALSISDISGQMLSARLLGGRGRVREEHRRIVRVERGEYAGQPVLAVERGGTLVTAADAQTAVASADAVWVCAV